MENAVGEVQNILVLGGRSEIGVAIARELLTPSTQRVTLACRKPDESREVEASLARNGALPENVRAKLTMCTAPPKLALMHLPKVCPMPWSALERA
jgi:NAD(P)-dependent dehydrogenase (short-subunit alcohol dehydrogenase family)